MKENLIQLLIASRVQVIRMYFFIFFLILQIFCNRRKLRIKNVSLFFVGKFYVLIQIKMIRLFNEEFISLKCFWVKLINN